MEPMLTRCCCVFGLWVGGCYSEDYRLFSHLDAGNGGMGVFDGRQGAQDAGQGGQGDDASDGSAGGLGPAGEADAGQGDGALPPEVTECHLREHYSGIFSCDFDERGLTLSGALSFQLREFRFERPLRSVLGTVRAQLYEAENPSEPVYVLEEVRLQGSASCEDMGALTDGSPLPIALDEPDGTAVGSEEAGLLLETKFQGFYVPDTGGFAGEMEVVGAFHCTGTFEALPDSDVHL